MFANICFAEDNDIPREFVQSWAESKGPDILSVILKNKLHLDFIILGSHCNPMIT